MTEKAGHLCLRVAGRSESGRAWLQAACTTHSPAGTILFATMNSKGTWATTLVLPIFCAAAMPKNTNVTTTNQFACFINCLRELIQLSGEVMPSCPGFGKTSMEPV